MERMRWGRRGGWRGEGVGSGEWREGDDAAGGNGGRCGRRWLPSTFIWWDSFGNYPWHVLPHARAASRVHERPPYTNKYVYGRAYDPIWRPTRPKPRKRAPALPRAPLRPAHVRGGKPLSFFLFIFLFSIFPFESNSGFLQSCKLRKNVRIPKLFMAWKNVQDMINLTDSKNVRDFRKCSYVKKMFMNF